MMSWKLWWELEAERETGRIATPSLAFRPTSEEAAANRTLQWDARPHVRP
jgi:hypothetical protein